MKAHFRIVFSTLASLLVLGLVTLVIVPFVVDVNDFKAQIEAIVQDNTGRVLTIEGDIELSVFPWLGISTEKMTLNNAEGFSAQPFAQIEQSQIKVKLWPLLFNQVEVSEIVLKGLKLNLSKKPQGLSNWDDLLALISNNQEQSKNPLNLLEIAGISIKDAQIIWDDQQSGKNIKIKDFNLSAGKLVFNQPIEIVFDLAATDTQLALTEIMSFSANLTFSEALDKFSLDSIKLQTETEGDLIPSGKLVATLQGDANFDLKKQKLQFAPLQIQTGALTISSASLTANLQPPFKLEGAIHIPNFDAAKFIQQQLAIKLPKMVDEKALTWLAADFQLNADANHARLQNLEIQLDETSLKGSAQLTNFSNPAINFNLALDTLNFDRYLPPPSKEDELQNLNSIPSAVAENATLFPVETLRNLNLNGQLMIDDLKVSNLTMQGVRLLINAKSGLLQSQQSVDRLYQGAYNGKVVVDMSTDSPSVTLRQQLSHIQIEPLLADLNGESRFSGVIDLNTKLDATGNTSFALKSSLNGRLSFLGREMLIRGINLQKLIDNGKILLSATPMESNRKKDQTAFSKITGTAVINNGFLRNNDLSAIAANTKIGGMGVLNLVSQQLDYRIIAILLKEKMTATRAKVINNVPVFINIGGTFNAPAYQVDLAAMGVGL